MQAAMRDAVCPDSKALYLLCPGKFSRLCFHCVAYMRDHVAAANSVGASGRCEANARGAAGYDIILNTTGRDATEDFEEIGHSNAAREMLDKYLIGNFEVHWTPVFWQSHTRAMITTMWTDLRF